MLKSQNEEVLLIICILDDKKFNDNCEVFTCRYNVIPKTFTTGVLSQQGDYLTTGQQGDYLKLPGNVILAWDLCCSSRWPSELKRKTLKARCSIPTITYQQSLKCII